MKVAIYSPYLDTLGGGERYILTIAEILSKTESVDLLIDDHLFSMGAESLKDQSASRFDLDLSKVRVIHAPIGSRSNPFSKAFFLKKYDILFCLTDGSIFYPTAKKNILHIQSPIIGQPAKSIWGKLKLKGWDLIIYNSNFTKKNSENNWPIKSEVIYPPADVDKIKILEKKKYILSVGRFFGFLKDKKQELLIDIFKDLYKAKSLNGWSLHLAGSATEGDRSYLEQLQRRAKGLPVKFYPNLEYERLITLYGQSSIYWHAAGFGEEDPTKLEHFGISTVEAMAGGCVPVVIGKGGQLEIVEDKKSGFLWTTLNSLREYTLKLIENEDLREKISIEAVKRAHYFSKNNFETKILQFIKIPE